MKCLKNIFIRDTIIFFTDLLFDWLIFTGEGWIPTCDLSSVKGALFKAGEQSGSMITPTMEKIPTTEVHPTYHRFYNGNRNGKFDNKTSILGPINTQLVIRLWLTHMEWTLTEKSILVFSQLEHFHSCLLSCLEMLVMDLFWSLLQL